MMGKPRCELTDEQLRFGDHEDLREYAGEIAEELLAYRSAAGASNERVREVVKRAMIAEMGLRGDIPNSIANRVAEQLTAPVQLSEDDRGVLRFMRGIVSVGVNIAGAGIRSSLCAAAVDLIDRLLGAAR